MSFCRNCGAETPEDELKLYSGQCRVCNQSLMENSNEDSLYPKFYPSELIHLNKIESIPASFETAPVPSIEEIKRLSKYKIKINLGTKNLQKIFIVIVVSLPFLFPFIFIHAIANTLVIDYLQAVINYYLVVTIYTNLIYYGIIGLSFLAGGLGGLIGEDSDMILPVSICFIVIFVIIFVIVGYPICSGFAHVWFG